MKDIVTGLTDVEIALIHQLIDAMHTIVDRFAISLTEKQRSAKPALGDRRLHFTLRSFDFAKDYPGLMSGNRSYTNFTRISRDWMALAKILRRLKTLNQAVDDTNLEIGANFHTYARTFYNRVQESLEDGLPGLTAVHQDLSVQFDNLRGGGNNNGPTDEATDGLIPVGDPKSPIAPPSNAPTPDNPPA